MKKTVLVLIVLIALCFCSCDNASDGADVGTTASGSKKEVVMSEIQSIKVDAINYSSAEIQGVTKLGDSGIRYAYCSTANTANETISSLNAQLNRNLTLYDTSARSLILTVITLGEGKTSEYNIEKTEMGDSAALYVYITTGNAPADTAKTEEYHFMRIDAPICGKIYVILDGEQIN